MKELLELSKIVNTKNKKPNFCNDCPLNSTKYIPWCFYKENMKDVKVVIVSMNPPESLNIGNLTTLYREFSSDSPKPESAKGTLPHFLWNLLSKVSTEERKKFANWFNNDKKTSKIYWTHLVKCPVEEYMEDNNIKRESQERDKKVLETFKKSCYRYLLEEIRNIRPKLIIAISGCVRIGLDHLCSSWLEEYKEYSPKFTRFEDYFEIIKNKKFDDYKIIALPHPSGRDVQYLYDWEENCIKREKREIANLKNLIEYIKELCYTY
ncbi:MAG: hypothetical protein QXJ14_04625 [Candidatus Aenigmatarchaeota archaeon]